MSFKPYFKNVQGGGQSNWQSNDILNVLLRFGIPKPKSKSPENISLWKSMWERCKRQN